MVIQGRLQSVEIIQDDFEDKRQIDSPKERIQDEKGVH